MVPSTPRQRIWLKALLWAFGVVVALCAAVSLYFIHYFRSFDMAKTFAYMESARPPFEQLFRYNLYALHPTASEVVELNQRAGAQIVLDMEDTAEQERLLSHLIAAGLNVNAQEEKYSLTALHLARDPKDVSLLLAHGARVDVKDARGLTPLEHALISGAISLAQG